MAPINLEQVSKRYPNGFEAVHDLDLDVAEGELMVLVGPSGCGKTTALRMVAGLEDITGGTLRIGGQVVNDVSPRDRDVAMVFQNYALYPHMTVAENIGFSLKLRKMPKNEIREKVRNAANILGLTEWLDRKPGQLSGGQRQRVAMGRAIVREPSVFLMDEPLSNLDAKLRVQMRAEVSRIQRRIGVATLYVTHDQTEAMTMGDRVTVLRLGRLQQCNSPQVLYDRPDNLFVAAFIGSPAMNLYRAQLTEGASSLQLGSQTVRIPESVRLNRPGLAAHANSRLIVGIRPEDLPAATTDTPATADSQDIEGEVELVEALGSELLVHFTIDAPRVHAEDVQEDAAGLDAGELDIAGEGVARIDPRAAVKVGQRMRFRLNPDRLHFFDSDSGIAIW
jgi:multiple sugar transport system ATP-binding protein